MIHRTRESAILHTTGPRTRERESGIVETDTCLASKLVNDTLWQVRIEKHAGYRVRKYIVASGIFEVDSGFVVESCEERNHPDVVSCPLTFLADVEPAACEKWRKEVRAWHQGNVEVTA